MLLTEMSRWRAMNLGISREKVTFSRGLKGRHVSYPVKVKVLSRFDHLIYSSCSLLASDQIINCYVTSNCESWNHFHSTT